MQYLIAHLIGDFLLQNHWMQKKTHSSFVAYIHAVCYMQPFFYFTDLPWLAVVAIGFQHFVQDRYRLGALWSKLMRQTPADKWPQGPLWVDQSLHLVWIAIVIHYWGG